MKLDKLYFCGFNEPVTREEKKFVFVISCLGFHCSLSQRRSKLINFFLSFFRVAWCHHSGTEWKLNIERVLCLKNENRPGRLTRWLFQLRFKKHLAMNWDIKDNFLSPQNGDQKSYLKLLSREMFLHKNMKLLFMSLRCCWDTKPGKKKVLRSPFFLLNQFVIAKN